MSRNRRSSKSKNIDRQMELLKRDFLVVARNKAGEKKSFAAGKYAASLPAAPMMSSLLTYLAAIISFGGKNKAAVKKMLEHTYPNADVQPMVEGLESLVNEVQIESLMEDAETDLNDLRMMIEFEPVLMKMQSLTEEFEFGSPQRLSVAVLREELKSVVKGSGKVASPKKVSSKGPTKTPSEKFATKLWSFYDSFQKKLTVLGVTDDAKRLKFLSSLMDMVPRLKITQNAEVSKSHG